MALVHLQPLLGHAVDAEGEPSVAAVLVEAQMTAMTPMTPLMRPARVMQVQVHLGQAAHHYHRVHGQPDGPGQASTCTEAWQTQLSQLQQGRLAGQHSEGPEPLTYSNFPVFDKAFVKGFPCFDGGMGRVLQGYQYKLE